MDGETPLIKPRASRTASGQTSMSGAIIFWFVMSSLFGIFFIYSFISNIVSYSSYGTYSSSTPVVLMTTMIWLIYTIISMILVGGKSARLFVAISHIVISVISMIITIFCMIALGQVNSYTYRYSLSSGSIDILNAVYTVAACFYLAAFCFYMIYGLYFISGDGAKKWFGNTHASKRVADSDSVLEYRVPSKTKKSTAIVIRCNNCSGEISRSMKFCPKCGSELDWGD